MVLQHFFTFLGPAAGENTHSGKADKPFSRKTSHHLPRRTPKVYSSNVRKIICRFEVAAASHPDIIVGESVSKLKRHEREDVEYELNRRDVG